MAKKPGLVNVIAVDPDTRNSAVVIARPSWRDDEPAGEVLAVGVALNYTKAVEGSHRAARLHRVAEQCHSVQSLVLRAMQEYGGIRVGVTEMPLDYGSKRHAQPQDIVDLSAVAGSALGAMGRLGVGVAPADYKGQRPKHVSERDALTYFGWTVPKPGVARFKIPREVERLTDIPVSAYGDVRDVLVIAKYAILRARRRAGSL